MVKVLLFAGLAEMAHQREVEVEYTENMTVETLRRQIERQFPHLANEVPRALVSINRAYAKEDAPIRADDEIGLIPPVGGGADAASRSGLTTDPLDISRIVECLEDPRLGGMVVFSGNVREWTRDKQTHHLEYEAYDEMALSQIQGIQSEIEARWPGTVTVCWHRLGVLKPTDVAVVCAAASPHRNEAFLAARELIDRVKQEVPIWKKEFYVDGDAVWQENA